jgi:glycogen(starch) synthase
MTDAAQDGRLRTLQIGMGWFPEGHDGGLDRVYYDLVRALPRVGVAVRGVVAGSPEVVRSSGGQVRALAPPAAPLLRRWWGARRLVRRALAGNSATVVAAHFALYTAPVLDLIRSQPLVVHFHGPWALEGQVEGQGCPATGLKYALERAVYRRGARFIVLSQAFGEVLHRSYRIPADRIRVVPPGVDLSRFAVDLTRAQARARLGWPQDRPVVLAVRRLTRRMGLEDLVTAMCHVRTAVPDALLVIAGRGPLADVLAHRILALRLTQHVRLAGFVPEDDLPLAYRAADLTVAPTTALEGFGLNTLESLAAGTPVLVTPVGGLPEAVRGLSPDLVLTGTGPGPLADGLTAALRGTMGLPNAEACRAYVRAHHDWPVVAARVRDVYAEVV